MANSELHQVNVSTKAITDYLTYAAQTVNTLLAKSKDYQNLKITHLNATANGGGVAEMLNSIVPLQRSLGLDSSWYIVPPDDAFFEITKQIHNYLQGREGKLTEKQKETYLNYNKTIARLLDDIASDVLIIHDPQPAAALSFMQHHPRLCIWRCHIDTSSPNGEVWQFIDPYVQVFDELVFTMPDFVNQNIPLEKQNFITPVIDPLSVKNRPMPKLEARSLLSQLGLDLNKHLITQVSRLDPWKDPIGVIDAFVLAKKQIPNLQLAFVAQMADDDPEGVRMAEETKEYAKSIPDIKFFINLDENDKLVNAFQTASTAILQKSLKEGFGLTVTEAMYKKAIVIAGNVGGIKLQIEDGKNGFLVNSIEEAAEKIVYVVKHPEEMEKIGLAAHQTVKSKYLTPHLLLNYFKVFDQYFK